MRHHAAPGRSRRKPTACRWRPHGLRSVGHLRPSVWTSPGWLPSLRHGTVAHFTPAWASLGRPPPTVRTDLTRSRCLHTPVRAIAAPTRNCRTPTARRWHPHRSLLDRPPPTVRTDFTRCHRGTRKNSCCCPWWSPSALLPCSVMERGRSAWRAMGVEEKGSLQ
jgi:hypothetical protein